MIVVSAIVINPTALRSNAIQEVSTGDNTGMVMSKVPVIILLCALWKRYRVDSPLLFVTQDYMSKLFKAVSHDYDENWLKHLCGSSDTGQQQDQKMSILLSDDPNVNATTMRKHIFDSWTLVLSHMSFMITH